MKTPKYEYKTDHMQFSFHMVKVLIPEKRQIILSKDVVLLMEKYEFDLFQFDYERYIGWIHEQNKFTKFKNKD